MKRASIITLLAGDRMRCIEIIPEFREMVQDVTYDGGPVVRLMLVDRLNRIVVGWE